MSPSWAKVACATASVATVSVRAQILIASVFIVCFPFCCFVAREVHHEPLRQDDYSESGKRAKEKIDGAKSVQNKFCALYRAFQPMAAGVRF